MAVSYLQLALSMSIVGANVALGKMIVTKLPLFLFSEIRFIIALLFLVPMLLMQGQTTACLAKKNWFSLCMQAFFGVFLFNIFLLYGVQYTTAASAGIITSTIPAAIAFTSFFLLGDRLSLRQTLAILLSVAGITAINLTTFPLGSQGSFLGNILIVGAVLSEALFTIYAKKLTHVLTPLQMAVGVNFLGLLFFLPFAVQELSTVDMRKLDISLWLLVTYYSVTASVLSFIFWYRGIQKVPASIAGLFTGFVPLSAIMISIFCLDEQVSLRQWIGMFCVLYAIYLGAGNSVKQEPRKNNSASDA